MSKMNTFDSQRQRESMKRRWQDLTPFQNTRLVSSNPNPNHHHNRFLHSFSNFDENVVDHHDLVAPPAVTVVLEGRSICQRISLHKHASYQSLAKALRQMFVDGGDGTSSDDHHKDLHELDLSNAVPGHLVAYEDMENDLLLAGDLSWKDFVRVAKRIRILPVKGNTRKGRSVP